MASPKRSTHVPGGARSRRWPSEAFVFAKLAFVFLSLAACTSTELVPRVGYDRFIDPVTSPAYFESPFIQDNVRLYGLYQDVPDDGLAPGGGDVRALGAQFRLELDENTAFVMNKLGLLFTNADDGDDERGWMDMGFGFKYSLVRIPEDSFILTLGLGYENDQGTQEVLQGNGEGLWNPYVSFAHALGDINLMGNGGALLPVSGSKQSTLVHYHLHTSYRLDDNLTPFIELNGYTVIRDGSEVDLEFEGGDLFNFGADQAKGDDLITLAPGLRYAVPGGDLGVAFEFPLTQNSEFMDWRLTLDYSIGL